MLLRSAIRIVGLAAVAALLLGGCGSDDKPRKSSLATEIVDSIASAVATQVTATAPEVVSASEVLKEEDSFKVIADVEEMLIVEPKLYAVFDGGVVVYDFEKESYDVIPAFEKLDAIAFHEGQVYVGGAGFYTVGDSTLQPVDMDFAGHIMSLYSYGYRLMVGTTSGLYATGLFGGELLFDEISVSAMTADESGLWVGTNGDGLYRWDGEEFRKRYLLRDTCIFDVVNTLDFKHRHLYVGTPNGFHIYDGGRWETLTALDGLPADNVRTVDASEWVILLATDEGVISYFNGDFMPVKAMEETRANALCRRGRKVIAATDGEGIVIKSGNVVRTLVPPDNGLNFNILSLIP
ncbi:MAG: hypothetical protein JSW34_07870 [Candidatus Zixiibacteriota bacterium]|nr:MAG: hypothetical protein JSW34_07870 [candidate division Zixibacteria bacterium]